MLSVIVPAYQAGRTIYVCLELLLASLDRLGRPYEVIVVVDGSTDSTVAEVARHLARVRVLSYDRNRGKGFAVRHGLAHSTGDVVAYIDADMELHPDGLGQLADLLDQGYDAALGSKRHPDSLVNYPPFRRLQSTAYLGLVHLLFGLALTDTQTGLKVFRGDRVRQALPLLTCDGFAFDLELLVVLRQLGSTFVEGPIELDYQFGTTTSLRAAAAVLRDTLDIWMEHGGRVPRSAAAKRYVSSIRARRRRRLQPR